LAYVASLEERLRAFESNGVQANIQLQKLAKKLDSENRKLKRVLSESCGIGDSEIERMDTNSLIEEIKSKMQAGGGSGNVPPKRSPMSRASSFSGGMIETSSASWLSYSTSPFQGSWPSATISDIRSTTKPPTPPPSKDDNVPTATTGSDLLLTLAPQTATTNCGEGLNVAGKRFCGLLQLLASESNGVQQQQGSRFSGKTVPCRVSYELLKSLINEQDSLGMENAAFVLKDGVRIGENGCQVDAKVLTKVLEELTNNVDQSGNNILSGELMAVDV
jgi:hypothetical protein